MTILVDSREQRPWSFPEGVTVRPRSTIRQGDYALDGDGTFSIERKSVTDFRGTVAGKAANWERFVRELRRMDDIGCLLCDHFRSDLDFCGSSDADICGCGGSPDLIGGRKISAD